MQDCEYRKHRGGGNMASAQAPQGGPEPPAEAGEILGASFQRAPAVMGMNMAGVGREAARLEPGMDADRLHALAVEAQRAVESARTHTLRPTYSGGAE